MNVSINADQIKTLLDVVEDVQLKQREHHDEIVQLKQRGSSSSMDDGFSSKRGASLGAQVVRLVEENRDLLSKSKSLRLEIKAASDPLTTSSARRIVSGGVGSPVGGVLGVQNGMRVNSAGGASAAEYSRFLALEGAAGVQAGEGVAKAAVRPTFSLINQPALTVAGFTKISKQALNDSGELRSAIDTTLVRSVGTALDDALMGGNVTPAFSGLLALATAYTSLTYTAIPDAASEAVSTMQTAGFMPDVVVLSPADWLAIQTAVNGTTGDYFSGSYLGPLPEALRGLRVVLSPTMTAGKVMVMDSAHIELQVVDGFAVEIGFENDDFTKNIATILGEMRVIPVFRAVGAARLITPKA